MVKEQGVGVEEALKGLEEKIRAEPAVEGRLEKVHFGMRVGD